VLRRNTTSVLESWPEATFTVNPMPAKSRAAATMKPAARGRSSVVALWVTWAGMID